MSLLLLLPLLLLLIGGGAESGPYLSTNLLLGGVVGTAFISFLSG